MSVRTEAVESAAVHAQKYVRDGEYPKAAVKFLEVAVLALTSTEPGPTLYFLVIFCLTYKRASSTLAAD